ncbi:MAG: methionyl-tRNA formyltransferase [Spirochaetales bacterium]|nr:methionyl-tRNA formyltransferase [Spirochaetales bacterium]
MRILFAGSPLFALPSLEMIAGEFPVCGVLTAPDKRAGRGKSIVPGIVKQKALSLSLKVFDPVILDDNLIAEIKKVNPDIMVVAAYGKIFKEAFLSIFPQGGINIHPSLLPRFRGPSPIPAAILAGESESGVTIQRLALKMDQGNILMQKSVPLRGTETTLDLTEEFSHLGAIAVIEVLKAMENNTIKETPQDHDAATYCKLIKKEQGKIDWNEGAEYIDRQVRAYFPWPMAYTSFKEMQLLITKASVYDSSHCQHDHKPGHVVGIDNKKGFLIQTGKGILCVAGLKLQAKREMNFKDFYNGHKDIINTRLGE